VARLALEPGQAEQGVRVEREPPSSPVVLVETVLQANPRPQTEAVQVAEAVQAAPPQSARLARTARSVAVAEAQVAQVARLPAVLAALLARTATVEQAEQAQYGLLILAARLPVPVAALAEVTVVEHLPTDTSQVTQGTTVLAQAVPAAAETAGAR